MADDDSINVHAVVSSKTVSSLFSFTTKTINFDVKERLIGGISIILSPAPEGENKNILTVNRNYKVTVFFPFNADSTISSEYLILRPPGTHTNTINISGPNSILKQGTITHTQNTFDFTPDVTGANYSIIIKIPSKDKPKFFGSVFNSYRTIEAVNYLNFTTIIAVYLLIIVVTIAMAIWLLVKIRNFNRTMLTRNFFS